MSPSPSGRWTRSAPSQSSGAGRWPRAGEAAPSRGRATPGGRWPRASAPAPSSKLSGLVNAAQNALPAKAAKAKPVQVAGKAGSALAVLAAGAGAIIGGRQLQKRRQAADSELQPSHYGAPADIGQPPVIAAGLSHPPVGAHVDEPGGSPDGRADPEPRPPAA